MAKPNYAFEKRQKEIAKKKKQEEKQAEKRLQKAAQSTDTAEHESTPAPTKETLLRD